MNASSASPLRILMVSEDLPHPSGGGLAKHVLLLARALERAGHRVDLMGNGEHSLSCMPASELPSGSFFPDLTGAQRGWKEGRLGIFNPLRRALLARSFARRIVGRAADYDVIHYHGHAPDLAAFVPASINFVQTRHDQGADCIRNTRFRDGRVCRETSPQACAGCAGAHPNALQTAISALAVKQFRHRVASGFRRHRTLFVSDMLRRNLCRSLGGTPDAWGRVIHNFVAWEAMRPLASGPRPVSPGRRVMVAGKVSPEKGVREFLDAFVPQMPPQLDLIVVGDGPLLAALDGKHASEQVRFLGWRAHAEVLTLAASADIAVVPSLCEEAFGLVTLEALVLGCEVHALDLGGTPELGAYQRYEGQLNLHRDMEALARAVAESGFRAGPVPEALPRCDVGDVLPSIIEVYLEGLRHAD